MVEVVDLKRSKDLHVYSARWTGEPNASILFTQGYTQGKRS